MFKLHLNEDGSLVLPAQVRDWMGGKPGEDLMVTVEGQKLVLPQWEDGAGILARYSKPERGNSALGKSASDPRRAISYDCGYRKFKDIEALTPAEWLAAR